MIANLNQSALHNEIQIYIQSWFREHGFKPVETELEITKGWKADVAGVIIPTPTECQKLKVVERKPPPLDYAEIINPNTTEEQKQEIYDQHDREYQEWHKKVSHVPYMMTAICEVKVSKEDYRKDIVRKFSKTPACLNFIAYPKGLLNCSELPNGWFGLERILPTRYKLHPGIYFEKSKEEMFDMVYGILIKKYNVEYYHQHFDDIGLDLQKLRDEHSERKMNYKVSYLLRALVDLKSFSGKVLTDNQILDTLKYHGVRKVDYSNVQLVRKILDIKDV